MKLARPLSCRAITQLSNCEPAFAGVAVNPVIRPDLAMEISGWYEGQFRTESGNYGFGGNQSLQGFSHLFWGRAAADLYAARLETEF